MKPRVTFIINRKIKQKKLFISAIEEIFIDFPKIIVQTEYRYHAMILAQQLAESSDFIISVGGDGTLNEVVNGLLLVPDSIKENIILGALPAGKGNDFVRTVTFGNTVEKLRELILKRQYKKVSLGYIEYTTTYDKQATRYFVNIADIGLGAETVKRLNFSPHIFSGSTKYLVSGMQVFLMYKPKYVKISGDSIHWQGRLTSLILANGKYFANGLVVAPDADPFDDKLQLVLVEEVGIGEFLKNLAYLRSSKRFDHPKVHYFDTKSVVVEPLEDSGKPLYVEADGEFLGKAPLKVSVVPAKIKFLTDL